MSLTSTMVGGRTEPARPSTTPGFPPQAPVDPRLWFVCPTLTPLYHTGIWGELDPAQQRCYNHLSAIYFLDLIAFFEASFSSVLRALIEELRRTGQPVGLCEQLESFLQEEQRHIEEWGRLTDSMQRSGAPRVPLHVPWIGRHLLEVVARRPARFTFVFWLMLALEERGLDLSRRCLRMDPETLDPVLRQAYLAHLEDEARHVRLDCRLIELYYDPRGAWSRRFNAALFARAMSRYFLPPRNSVRAIVNAFTDRRPELRPLAPRMVREIMELGNDAEFRRQVYSRKTSPILYDRLERYPEMRVARRVFVDTPNPADAGRQSRPEAS